MTHVLLLHITLPSPIVKLIIFDFEWTDRFFYGFYWNKYLFYCLMASNYCSFMTELYMT